MHMSVAELGLTTRTFREPASARLDQPPTRSETLTKHYGASLRLLQSELDLKSAQLRLLLDLPNGMVAGAEMNHVLRNVTIGSRRLRNQDHRLVIRTMCEPLNRFNQSTRSKFCPERDHSMSRKVADILWEMLANAGVKRCYGIVGDALNPVIDALRRNGKIEFIHVRHEEYGVFAAVAEAYLSGDPVVVCGTAGPGVVHLFNGLMDARKEGASIIAIAGDVETSVMDTVGLEELNPYKFFEAASLYTGRVVNPEQARPIFKYCDSHCTPGEGPHGDFPSRRRRVG
jgi:hypothetical protein